jgi:hypothetical protein
MQRNTESMVIRDSNNNSLDVKIGSVVLPMNRTILDSSMGSKLA